jgi:hypothetical protein
MKLVSSCVRCLVGVDPYIQRGQLNVGVLVPYSLLE